MQFGAYFWLLSLIVAVQVFRQIAAKPKDVWGLWRNCLHRPFSQEELIGVDQYFDPETLKNR